MFHDLMVRARKFVCWWMSMYWSMLSSTALVCIVDLTSIVDLMCVCWDVTYAEELLLLECTHAEELLLLECTYAEELLPKCCLVAGASTSLFVDLCGPPWHPSHRFDSRILCGFYLCVGHLHAVFTTSRHRLYCTKSIFYFSTA